MSKTKSFVIGFLAGVGTIATLLWLIIIYLHFTDI